MCALHSTCHLFCPKFNPLQMCHFQKCAVFQYMSKQNVLFSVQFLHMSEVSNKLVPCGHKSAISKLDRMCAIWFFHCTETSGSI